MSSVVIAKLVIETQSPLAIKSGFRESGFDSELARDANGLPYIPATAWVGVWKQVIQSQGHSSEWFGSLDKKSAVTVSHGVMLNSQGEPASGLRTHEELERDFLLKRVLVPNPLVRDRVALNDRGSAVDQAKFDQLLLPTGLRFCLCVKIDSQLLHKDTTIEEISSKLAQYLELVNSRRFALGSTTRNGLGQVKIHACEISSFNFVSGPEEGMRMQSFLRSEVLPVQNCLSESSADSFAKSYEIKLQALGAWRAGSGAFLLSNASKVHEPDIKTYSEPYVTWSKDGNATVEKPRAVFCGSSIKGALAHRVSFHWRRLNKQWAEHLADEESSTWQKRPKTLNMLFGNDRSEERDDNEMAGRLWIDDSIIDVKHTQVRFHNSVDRFTGGVRKGALFSEEVLYQPEFTLRIGLEPLPKHEHNELLLEALEATIQDLRNGLLPMGAASGRGNSLVREVQ